MTNARGVPRTASGPGPWRARAAVTLSARVARVARFAVWIAIGHALAAELPRNMTPHPADRVRTLTGDLSRCVSRAAAGRSAA